MTFTVFTGLFMEHFWNTLKKIREKQKKQTKKNLGYVLTQGAGKLCK